MPVQALGLSADPDTRSLVLPGTDIPGNWELIDEQSLRAGDQQLNTYHELQTMTPGRVVGLAVTRFDDAAAAAASLDSTITRANNAHQPGWLLDNVGDGTGVAFIYRVAETQVQARYGFDPDAMGETVMTRVDRYLLTVQVGGPADMLPDVDELAADLTDLQVSRVRGALAAASP